MESCRGAVRAWYLHTERPLRTVSVPAQTLAGSDSNLERRQLASRAPLLIGRFYLNRTLDPAECREDGLNAPPGPLPGDRAD
ncbi:hypothetical protein chiPu_0014655 [Chiloscyllium punctatum]|uniref:Uncharacterized protein n=1 Tax=Chiloscyllium punctatum TaxID=137246 RepID=A0A401T0J3_CHIPU|nr:hypothetical protein [Chiloscyllium punctatum]